MKKLLAILIAVSFAFQPIAFAEDEIYHVGSSEVPFNGLYRVEPTKAPDGAHRVFTDVYLEDGAIQSVRGRNRLNSTAASDPTMNGMAYYENAAGSVKKILIKEADEVVSYATNGTGRTSIVGSLTDQAIDFVQIGDTMYFTGHTDGLYKWTGSGSASAVGSVSAPSTVDFTVSSNVGAMTPGLDIIPAQASTTQSVAAGHSIQGNPYYGAGACVDVTGAAQDIIYADGTTSSATGQTGSPYLVSDDTSATYKYVVTKYNEQWGIESEASAVDSVTLAGASTFDVSCVSSWRRWASAACAGAVVAYHCNEQEFLVNADTRKTSTTGTLAANPGLPFDSYRIYRTVSGGENFFLLGSSTSFSAAYTDGAADASLGQPLDTTIDTITPPSYKYIEEYKGSIFLAEDTQVRFSRLPPQVESGADTYWLETDYIDIGTDSPITGLHKTQNSLLIFTANSISELTGFGATSFRLKNAIAKVGAVSDATIETDLQGDIIFYAGASGVYKLRTFDQPQVDGSGESVEGNRRVSLQRISSPMLDSVFSGLDDHHTGMDSNSNANAYYDLDRDMYFLYINNNCFVYDNKHNYWFHTAPVDAIASVWVQSPGASGKGILFDELGYLWENWTGYETSSGSGTVTGTATAGGNTTLTDSAATFDTTGDGLAGVWVLLANDENDEDGEWRRIVSNTATQLTVESAWTTNPIAGDTYYVGYLVPNIKTKWYSFGKVPEKTNANFCYFIHGKSETSQTFEMDITSYVDLSTEATNAKSFDLEDNYVDKIGLKGFGYWHAWEGKTYIYNTSNTIDPPLNLLEYGLTGEVVKET